MLDCRGLSAHCLLTWLRGEGGERNRGREIEKERDRDRDTETERRNEGENTPVRAMLFLLIRTVILWDQGSARTTHSTPITLLLQIQSRSQVGGQGSHSSVRSSRPVGLPRGPAVPVSAPREGLMRSDLARSRSPFSFRFLLPGDRPAQVRSGAQAVKGSASPAPGDQRGRLSRG